MLNFTQKKTSQAQAMDACSVLDGLASNVKTLIDLLPSEDKEVFAYLITYPSADANVERVIQGTFWKSKANAQPKSPQQSHVPNHSGKDNRKAGSIKKKGNHQPSFGCDCFQCYTFHWSRWDASPNRGLIHEAILLNESAGASKVQGTIDDKAEWEPEHSFKCDEDKGLNSTLSSKSKEIEVKALCLEESPTLNPEELEAVDIGQVVVDPELLKYPCNKAFSEKIPAMEVVVAERNSERQGSLAISPRRNPSKEENKPQKKKTPKKIKIAVKGSAGQQQGMHHHASPVQKVKGEHPGKYRTKQVAPIYDKDGCAAETSSTEQEANKLQEETPDAKGDGGKAQKSLTHVLSETWSFVADRLFALLYPRRRVRVPVF